MPRGARREFISNEKRGVMSRVSYLIKQSLFNFAYLILTMMTAMAIGLIEITWLKIILFVLNGALYCTIVFFSSRAQGEKEKKQEYANDVERRHVAETGDYVNINEREEYKPLNGFFTGLITCVPLLILYVFFLIFTLTGAAQNTVVVITNLIYGTFTLPLEIVDTADQTVRALNYFCSLYAVAVICAVTSFGYWMGAQRVVKQHERVEHIHKQIYGDKQ